ncbi:4-hydroxy-3-methylbut-2-enyl diphosphate reductase, partial [Pseudomonas sp. MWU12-2323]|nr:4-hydroxy-3-methylbut-2-enyl diphosphate reductase [Pseudomonas sp. MWU12-2323]
ALKGVDAYMVDNASLLEPQWFVGKQRVGLTAGASAPEVLVQAVIDRIKTFGIGQVAELPGVEESTVFALPPALQA